MAVAGDINIGKAVVVIIRDRNPGGPALGCQPCGRGDVSEVQCLAVAILPVERDHGIAASEVAVD